MPIEFTISTAVVEAADLADIAIELMDFDGRLQSVPKTLLAKVLAAQPWTYSIPDSDGPITFALNVRFRRSDRTVTVGATSHNAGHVQVHQISPTYVIANIQHRVDHIDGQCTVRCPRSGESRTGLNVCIECGTPDGAVKICC